MNSLRAHCALPRSSASENVLPFSASAGRWQVKQGRPKTVVQPPRHGSAPCAGEQGSMAQVWLAGLWKQRAEYGTGVPHV